MKVPYSAIRCSLFVSNESVRDCCPWLPMSEKGLEVNYVEQSMLWSSLFYVFWYAYDIFVIEI